jgi:ABC-2 type transport system permease protein
MSLRGLLAGKRWWIVVAADALLVLLVVIVALAGNSDQDQQYMVNFARALVLPLLLPFVSLIFASDALGAEVEDRTLVYLTLRPVPALSIALPKFAASTLISVVAVWLALIPGFIILTHGDVGPRMLIALLVSGAFGCLAYNALFVLLGLVRRQALLLGFIYVLLWEDAIAGLSTAAAHLSVRYYTLGIFGGLLHRDDLLPPADAGPAAAGSILFLVAVSVAAVACTGYRLRRLELP